MKNEKLLLKVSLRRELKKIIKRTNLMNPAQTDKEDPPRSWYSLLPENSIFPRERRTWNYAHASSKPAIDWPNRPTQLTHFASYRPHPHIFRGYRSSSRATMTEHKKRPRVHQPKGLSHINDATPDDEAHTLLDWIIEKFSSCKFTTLLARRALPIPTQVRHRSTALKKKKKKNGRKTPHASASGNSSWWLRT